MAGMLRSARCVLVVLTACACAISARAAQTEYPGLVDLNATHFISSLSQIGADYDWVLFECYAHWCPACKSFQPVYEKVAALLAARGAATPRVAVTRLDCAEYQALCSSFNISGYPTMLLGTAEQLKTMTPRGLVRIESAWRTAEGVIGVLEAQLHTKLLAPASQGGEAAGTGRGVQLVAARASAAQADLGDMEGATVKSWEYMQSAALLQGGEARAALESWVQLLAGSHPVQRCRAGAAAAAAALPVLWPRDASAPSDPGAMAALRICGATAFRGWRGCLGSQPNSRGYTCALWQLLHALAAQLPDAPGAGAGWLAAVRGYVRHFFQCSDCSRHFTAHATSPEAVAVASKRDAVLWIWRTHNAVNERLAGEDAASGGGDPLFPHVQWPGMDLCPTCRRDGGHSGNGTLPWDEDAVYTFLQGYYGGGGGAEGESAAGAGGAAPRSKQSSWSDAVLVMCLVATAVYCVLRNSGQYALRKAGCRLV